jgi:hypothetical protein
VNFDQARVDFEEGLKASQLQMNCPLYHSPATERKRMNLWPENQQDH